MASQKKRVILASSTILNAFVFGTLFTIGSILTQMLEKFQENRSTTVSVQAVLAGVGLCSAFVFDFNITEYLDGPSLRDGPQIISLGLLCGVVVEHAGMWRSTLIGSALCTTGFILAFFASSIVHLCIYIGFIAGLGISMIFVCCTTAIAMSHNGPQKVIGLTIHNLGVSVSGISLPYLFNHLANSYGLNGTFLIIGGINLNCFPVARLFAILEEQNKKDQDNSCSNKENNSMKAKNRFLQIVRKQLSTLKVSLLSVFTARFVWNCLGTGITMGSVIAFLSLTMDILSWKGLREDDALVSYPIIYSTGFVARMSTVLSKKCNGPHSLIMSIIYSVCGCVGIMFIYIFSNYALILVGCGLFGIAMSGVITSAIIVAVHMSEDKHVSVGVGLVHTSVGLFAAAVSPLNGAIRDWSNSYSASLMVIAGMMFLGTCCFVSATISWRRWKKISARELDINDHAHDNYAMKDKEGNNDLQYE